MENKIKQTADNDRQSLIKVFLGERKGLNWFLIYLLRVGGFVALLFTAMKM